MKTTSSFVLLASLLAGCGSSAGDDTQNPAPGSSEPPPAATGAPPATQPPATPPPLDHGAPTDEYPAFTPEMGQLVNNGGAVLASPVIVTVTWPDDPNAEAFEQFGDQVGAGRYWSDVTSEYGVGAAVSGAPNHVRLTEPAPDQITDAQLSAFVAQHVGSADGGWPAPTPGSVYILYLPKSTKLMLQGTSGGACQVGVGGYHDSVAVNGAEVAFAIVPQCGSLASVTVAASHELAEAATDPYPRRAPAWSGFDGQHLAWEFFQQFQSENGDACEFYRDSAISKTDLPFVVQRQWSNASARAGHDPCVPVISGQPYFNVTPLAVEATEIDLTAFGGGKEFTGGYTARVGETKTIPLGFYSDAPTSAWTIKAVEGGAMGTQQKGKLDLSLDVTSGQNGQKAYLTVKVNAQGRTKSELVTIVSTLGSTSHYMPILIGSPDPKK
jgi:hypothetical protein